MLILLIFILIFTVVIFLINVIVIFVIYEIIIFFKKSDIFINEIFFDINKLRFIFRIIIYVNKN
jgi:hypothetical protein